MTLLVTGGSGGQAELLRRAAAYLRRHGPGLGVELAVNFVLPYVIYDRSRLRFGEVGALIASSAPPLVWGVVEFARRRRVDAASLLSLAGIALSLLAFLGGGSAHMLQLREKLVTALIGLAFLGSAALRRPLIYELARAGLARQGAAELSRFEGLRDNPGFRRTMTVMTLVWGLGLLCEAALSCALVFALRPRAFLIASPILGNATMGALGVWTFTYGRRRRREGEARAARDAGRQRAAPSSSGTP